MKIYVSNKEGLTKTFEVYEEDNFFVVKDEESETKFNIEQLEFKAFSVLKDSESYEVYSYEKNNKLFVNIKGEVYEFDVSDVKLKLAKSKESAGEKTIKAEIPGKIIDIKVKINDEVKKGQVLLILEAMKMQNEITAPCDGKVKKIPISVGEVVESEQLLVELE